MKEKNNMIYFNGEELLKYRKQKGLSQEELAEKIGVSRQSIHLWESEKIIPDIENILKLCNVLEITTDKLAEGLDIIKNKKNNKDTKKILRIIFIIISIFIILYIIISIRKSIILIRLSEKLKNYIGINNYSYIEESYFIKDVAPESSYKIEVYYKDKFCKRIYTDSMGNNTIIYEDNNNNIKYNFDEINKTVEEILNYDIEYPENMSIPVGISTRISLAKESKIINFIYGFNPFFKIVSEGNEYIFYWSFKNKNEAEKITEKINKVTGLINERYTFKSNGTYKITFYDINMNSTTEEEIKLLNINDYKK